MFFEAMLKGKTFYIDVTERRTEWIVSLEEKGKKKEVHHINKEHYKSLDGAISFLFENSSYMIDVVGSGTNFTVYTRGTFRDIPLFNDEMLLHESLKGGKQLGPGDKIIAGMPGKIVEVFVKPGTEVDVGDPLIIMEAMKMENEIRATHKTVVKEVLIKKGDSVESGATLISFSSAES